MTQGSVKLKAGTICGFNFLSINIPIFSFLLLSRIFPKNLLNFSLRVVTNKGFAC